MGRVLLCLNFFDYKWQRNIFEDMEKRRRMKGSMKKRYTTRNTEKGVNKKEEMTR